jgi:hypothetical protein
VGDEGDLSFPGALNAGNAVDRDIPVTNQISLDCGSDIPQLIIT